MGGFEPQARWQASAFLAAGSSSFADFLTMAAPELLPRGAHADDGGVHGVTGAAGPLLTSRTAPRSWPRPARRRRRDGRRPARHCRQHDLAARHREGLPQRRVLLRRHRRRRGHRHRPGSAVRASSSSTTRSSKAGRCRWKARRTGWPAWSGRTSARPCRAWSRCRCWRAMTRRPSRAASSAIDVAGGKYEEHRFASIGSGSVFARGSLKKLYRDGMSVEDVMLALMQALYDAADDDSATGGPDMSRRIYPVVATVTADGYERLSDEQAGRVRAGRRDRAHAAARWTAGAAAPAGVLSTADHQTNPTRVRKRPRCRCRSTCHLSR